VDEVAARYPINIAVEAPGGIDRRWYGTNHSRDLLLVVLLGEQRPDHAHQRVAGWKDPDHSSPSLDLLVRSLESGRLR
jgi:hypothetical protein